MFSYVRKRRPRKRRRLAYAAAHSHQQTACPLKEKHLVHTLNSISPSFAQAGTMPVSTILIIVSASILGHAKKPFGAMPPMHKKRPANMLEGAEHGGSGSGAVSKPGHNLIVAMTPSLACLGKNLAVALARSART